MHIVGVIGAGQMGAGIAQVAAQAGYTVLIADISLDLAEKGKGGIAKQLARAVDKGKLSAADADAALARITAVADHAAFAPCDLVIEAATEREDVKRRIFESVGPHLSPTAILASNTSSIPITRLAQAAP
ncbi:MAG: 3-hydroxyacyl-CoA dehydrogenase NAD-binding domain-containing protein, partial [Sphingopyxis sp.]|nr:3-hydroxyacyl-CoA dehydrogenase NAD-binding domain-containing protein [Sphingopyxis sp.]